MKTNTLQEKKNGSGECVLYEKKVRHGKRSILK
jgi:hypothetical protein